MRHVLALASATILLSTAGCATVRGMTRAPVLVQASPTSITYRAAEGLRDEAKNGAEAHCEKQGKRAELEGVVPGDDTERSFTYRCV